MLYNCSEVKKEVDNLTMFKDILDNTEESSIIISNNNLEYANNRFLMKFKMNIHKCATDRMMEL